MKAKPAVSSQKIVDDMLAGTPVDFTPDLAQSFELEMKLTGSLDEIKLVVEYIKNQASKPEAAKQT